MGILSIFNKLKEPVFLKEDSTAKDTLTKLEVLLEKAPPQMKQQILNDIKIINYGINGEKNIAFELKNSYIPMYILHDLVLGDEGLTAQIDYLIITKKCVFVVECKNLVGNIEITSNGDFIRTFQSSGKYIKEGIYSPITQNIRHLELIKQIRLKERTNIITRKLFEHNFNKLYRSIVVLANDKTILNSEFAKEEIKNQVIRADQLISYINRINKECDFEDGSEKQMLDLANSFLGYHHENCNDYLKKYSDQLIDDIKGKNTTEEEQENISNLKKDAFQNNEIDKDRLIQELKAFRLKKSREENIKPYFIFSDNQLNDLITKRPKTLDELMNVSGFGEIKTSKYGNDIIHILKK